MTRAAFFDIDGTLTNERTWKGIMDYFTQHRLQRSIHWAFWGAHYPLYLLRKARLISENAFRTPWAANLAWYLRGYTPEQAQDVWDWVTEHFLSRYWRMDSRRLLDEHCRQSDFVMLVSAAPLPLVECIARELGAQAAVGTRLEIRDGRYTGRSLAPVVVDAGKAEAVCAGLQALGMAVDLPASFSYADSISDRSILELVGNPVAVYPDAALRRLAGQRGWRIFPE